MPAKPFLQADAGAALYVGVVGEDIASTTFTSLPRATAFSAAPGQTQKVNVNSLDTPLGQNDELNGRPQSGNGSISFWYLVGDAVQGRLINNQGALIAIRAEFDDGQGNSETRDSMFEIGTNDLDSVDLDEGKLVTVQLAKQGATVVNTTTA